MSIISTEDYSNKKCSKCKETKPLTSYYVDSACRKDGRTKQCKKCRDLVSVSYTNNRKKFDPQFKKRLQVASRISNRKRKYNVDKNQYQEMLNSQNGKCKICKVHNSHFKISLAIDHCHVTDKIRGLLCSNCNAGLGMFKDNINFLKTAMEYLNDNNV